MSTSKDSRYTPLSDDANDGESSNSKQRGAIQGPMQPSSPPPPYGNQPGDPVPVVIQPTPSNMYSMHNMNYTNPTNIVINNVQGSNTPSPRLWTTGLCDCCQDMGICVFGTFCGPCQACILATEMGESCCVPICLPAYLVTLRAKLRAHYFIQGTVMGDMQVACCCEPCIRCQMLREIKHLRATGQLGLLHQGV